MNPKSKPVLDGNITPASINRLVADVVQLSREVVTTDVSGLSSTTPSDIGTAAVGTGTTAARADHVHAITKAVVEGVLTGAITTHTHAYLSTAGGTLTGPVTLPDDPSANLHAATKQYVDGATGGVASPPICKAVTSSQSFASGSFVNIQWDSEEYDTDSMHNTAAEKDRLVPPKNGYYRVSACVIFNGNSSTGSRVLRIKKNDHATADLVRQFSPATGGAVGNIGLNATVTVYLTTSDYVTASLYQDTGSTLGIVTGSFLSMEFIRS